MLKSLVLAGLLALGLMAGPAMAAHEITVQDGLTWEHIDPVDHFNAGSGGVVNQPVLLASDDTAPAAAPATTISAGPVYQFAEPYILSAFGIVFSLLLTWGLAQLQTRTGIHLSDQAKASVQQAATNAAGRVLASLEPDAMKMQINVGSPLIAAEAQKMGVSVGEDIKKLGMTPDRVRDLVAAKIGILQAGAPQAAPVVPPVVVTKIVGADAMIDIGAAFRIITFAVTKASPIQTIQDGELLYGIYQQGKAGTLDFAALAKAGKLQPLLDALSRTAVLLDSVAKEQPDSVAALLASFSPPSGTKT